MMSSAPLMDRHFFTSTTPLGTESCRGAAGSGGAVQLVVAVPVVVVVVAVVVVSAAVVSAVVVVAVVVVAVVAVVVAALVLAAVVVVVLDWWWVETGGVDAQATPAAALSSHRRDHIRLEPEDLALLKHKPAVVSCNRHSRGGRTLLIVCMHNENSFMHACAEARQAQQHSTGAGAPTTSSSAACSVTQPRIVQQHRTGGATS